MSAFGTQPAFQVVGGLGEIGGGAAGAPLGLGGGEGGGFLALGGGGGGGGEEGEAASVVGRGWEGGGGRDWVWGWDWAMVGGWRVVVTGRLWRRKGSSRGFESSRKNEAAFFRPPPVSSKTSSREISMRMPKLLWDFR